jgi:hypothetical protein
VTDELRSAQRAIDQEARKAMHSVDPKRAAQRKAGAKANADKQASASPDQTGSQRGPAAGTDDEETDRSKDARAGADDRTVSRSQADPSAARSDEAEQDSGAAPEKDTTGSENA